MLILASLMGKSDQSADGEAISMSQSSENNEMKVLNVNVISVLIVRSHLTSNQNSVLNFPS